MRRTTTTTSPSAPVPAPGRAPRHRLDLLWRSSALVLLLASTWLIVGAALHDASTAVVSAGRTVFTVGRLSALSWWTTARATSSAARTPAPDVRSGSGPYRWWQLVLLALSGVSAYTVCSTVAIAFAGPVLPTLVLALTPATVLIAESVMTRAAPSLSTGIGTVLAIGGAVLYVLPRLDGTLGGDVLIGTVSALAAMGSMAFYGVFFARVNRGHVGPMAPRILPVFAVGSIPLVLWAATAVVGGDRVSWNVIGMLAVLGVVVYVPVYLLQHRLILTAGASWSALLGLAVPPLVGVGSALLHLAPVPMAVQLAGILVTVLGMALVIRVRRAPVPETA
ncbi:MULTISPECIES: DMT family transporter [unclassified Curtobacterium]|uniref:DMT family transporter n=1 Tax=unclassified Curtobacterium TaxID=257496 RepID=UPI00226B788A|nr:MULTISPECIES: DMT family transporter [unclassified Curtobacterium]